MARASDLKEALDALLEGPARRRTDSDRAKRLKAELFSDPDDFELASERVTLQRERTPRERAIFRADHIRRTNAGEYDDIKDMSSTELLERMDKLMKKINQREEFAEGGKVEEEMDFLEDEEGMVVRGDPYHNTGLRALREGVSVLPEVFFGKTGLKDKEGVEQEQRELTHMLSGLASQWYGTDEEGRAVPALSAENIGDVRPGIVDELLAIPTLSELWGGTPPQWAKDASDRSGSLRSQIRDDLELEDPKGFREHLMDSAGVMTGQVPVPGAQITKLKSAIGSGKGFKLKGDDLTSKLGDLAKRAGLAPVEWLSPIVDPKITNYLIGSLFGGTIGALTDPEVKDATNGEYESIEDLQQAMDEGDEVAEQILLELMMQELQSRGESPEGFAEGGKADLTRRGLLKLLGTGTAAATGAGRVLTRQAEDIPLDQMVKSVPFEGFKKSVTLPRGSISPRMWDEISDSLAGTFEDMDETRKYGNIDAYDAEDEIGADDLHDFLQGNRDDLTPEASDLMEFNLETLEESAVDFDDPNLIDEIGGVFRTLHKSRIQALDSSELLGFYQKKLQDLKDNPHWEDEINSNLDLIQEEIQRRMGNIDAE